eukprot:SAG31_NODE_30171_length_384_cov_1.642105_1_plen_53_part_01
MQYAQGVWPHQAAAGIARMDCLEWLAERCGMFKDIALSIKVREQSPTFLCASD